MENGNTMINCTNGNRFIEVNENDEIVWSVNNEEMSESAMIPHLYFIPTHQRVDTLN